MRATGRVGNARRLRGGPGVRTPRMALLPRAMLAGTAAVTGLGIRFPLLLRAPGFHTGQHFVQVEQPDGLAEAVATLPGELLLAIEVLPARGADGMARKYRVMIVGGRLYPLHLAISPDWKVHYFTAVMAGSAAFRAEEERFLADMARALWQTGYAGRWPGSRSGWRWIMPGSILAWRRTGRCCCSRPTPRWRWCRHRRGRSGITGAPHSRQC